MANARGKIFESERPEVLLLGEQRDEESDERDDERAVPVFLR